MPSVPNFADDTKFKDAVLMWYRYSRPVIEVNPQMTDIWSSWIITDEVSEKSNGVDFDLVTEYQNRMAVGLKGVSNAAITQLYEVVLVPIRAPRNY